MGLESSVSELQTRTQEMAKYYCKGFKTNMATIMLNGMSHLKNPEMQQYSEQMLELFNQIGNFYANIPFYALERAEFYTLFAVRDLLPHYQKALYRFFEDKSEEALDNLDNVAGRIHYIGGLYFSNLQGIMLDIRAIPGQEDFDIEITDLSGRVWSLAYALMLPYLGRKETH